MPTVDLPSFLDLPAAAPLRSHLLSYRGQDLDLDAAGVERMGGLCLQILLSAKQSWDADQKAFRIINMSETCRDAFRLAQAGAALGVED